jgi:peptidoglycan hydrolase CwlO-like protein
VLALICAVALCVPCALTKSAYAVTTDTDTQPDALQQRIEDTSAAYDEATSKLASLDSQISDAQSQINQIEAVLPAQKAKSSNAVAQLYRLQCSTNEVLQMIFGAQSLSDFIQNVEYISRVQNKYVDEINTLTQMDNQLQSSKNTLQQSRADVATEQQKAKDALADAQAAREEAQKQAEAAAASQAAQAQAPSSQASGGSGGSVSAPPTNDGANWSSDKQTFVNQWAPRINAYLSGTPLAGTGQTFAEAAWDYGVDPRWSPAISYTESSCGLYCFASHNAWGWGSSSWPDWDTAIRAQVQGLARGYGYTISVEAAQKYCPPNWQHWYNTTVAQMNQI